MVFLANHQGEWPIPGARIAKETNVPSRYLSAIMSDLVRAGVLEASPGPTGGFRMARPPNQIRLADVLTPFDGSIQGINGCPFGNETCNDEKPCAGHSRWKLVKEAYIQFLEETSVQDVSIRDVSIREANPAVGLVSIRTEQTE
jgi:Rrf2 family transcriptional regulator, iron-sulfur cluster assembly transcription factor